MKLQCYMLENFQKLGYHNNVKRQGAPLTLAFDI